MASQVPVRPPAAPLLVVALLLLAAILPFGLLAAPPDGGPPSLLAAPNTSVALNPVADAFIDSGYPTANYGTATTLLVGADLTCPGAASPQGVSQGRSLLRFDLSGIPAGQIIDNATLELYLRYSTGDAVNTTFLRGVKDTWVEGTVTWAKPPGQTVDYDKVGVGLTTGTWHSWNAVDLAREWYKGITPNRGLFLLSANEVACNLREFDSRENTNKPKLTISYHVAPTSTATPTHTWTVTPSVTPTVTGSPTPSLTPTGSRTVTPSATPTATPTATWTVTPSVTRSVTPSLTPTGSRTVTPSVTPSITPSATKSVTPSLTPTVTRTRTPTYTPSPTPSATFTPYVLLPDITVTGLEITQGIQDLDNHMPLVQDRETIARAYVHASLFNCDGVRARLHARRGGVELAGSPRPAENVITVRKNGGDRLKLDESFWFIVPPEWWSGTVEFTVDVNYDRAVPERHYDNNSLARTVTFLHGNDLNVVAVPFHLHDHGNHLNPVLTYYQSNADFWTIAWNMLRFHPISTVNIWDYDSPEYPDGHGWPFYGEWDVSTRDGQSAVLGRVAWKDFWTSDWVGNLHWMGMLHPSLDTSVTGGWVAGMGYQPGWQFWAKMEGTNGGWPDWYVMGGGTMAHELGHNLGLQHVNCDGTEDDPDPNYPWPDPNCQLSAVDPAGYYGLDVYHYVWGLAAPTVLSNNPAAAWPNHAFPLMGYRGPQWVSPWEYCKLERTYGISCGVYAVSQSAQEARQEAVAADPTAFADAGELQALQTATAYIAAGGLISTTAGAASFDAIYQISDPGADALRREAEKLGYRRGLGPSAGQPFTLAQVDAGGQVAASREIYLPSDDGGGEVRHFLELVPLAARTVRVQVRQGAAVLAERAASAHAPTVQLLAPNGGEHLVPGAAVRWTAADQDNDTLTFNLQYSPDNGQTWRLVAMGLTGNSFSITSLAGWSGSDQGRLRVLASDGFNTAQDDSDGAFSVPDSAPSALIAQPPPGAVIPPGRSVLLQGTATDWEDGPLSSTQLAWNSDRDGALGAGRAALVDSLSPGLHHITLTATDSSGQRGSASVSVYVGFVDYLPIVLRAD